MIVAPLSSDEAARQEVLAALDLLDTPPEAVFDCATRSVARALAVPIALVSIIDGNRQWFKSGVGLPVRQTDRGSAFCAHTILGEGPMIVEDARCDVRFADNPLVVGAPHIRFYVGVPITAANGIRIGTLCAIDTQPRRLDDEQLALLRDLAFMLSRELYHRQAAILARNHVDSTRVALEEGEALFRSVFELAAMGVAIVAPDGRFLRVNQALSDIVGYSAEEMVSLSFQHITHPDDLDADLLQVDRILSGEIDHYQIDKRYITKKRETVWVSLTVAEQRANAGGTQYFIAIIEDISARRRSAEQIAALTVNLEAQVNDRTQQLKCLVEQAERRNQQLRTLSEATALLTAANTHEEVAAIIQQFIPLIYPSTTGALFLGQTGSYRAIASWGAVPQIVEQLSWGDCWALRRGEEHRIEDPSASLLCQHWRSHPVSPHTCVPVFALGEAVGLLELYWRDVTGEQTPDSVLLGTLAKKLGLSITNIKLREELRQQALHDPLTGLYNRRYLEQFIDRRLAEYRREGQGFALLMIDIDHFKLINDNFGHEFGDLALSELAGLLKRSIRLEEEAFRYGGEEFLMVIRCQSAMEARLCAERIRSSVTTLMLRNPRNADSPAPCFSVSIGVAACPAHGGTAPALLAGADAAVYAAKAKGRNCVCEASLPVTTALPAADCKPDVVPRQTMLAGRVGSR